jgi:hypothetical protein
VTALFAISTTSTYRLGFLIGLLLTVIFFGVVAWRFNERLNELERIERDR